MEFLTTPSSLSFLFLIGGLIIFAVGKSEENHRRNSVSTLGTKSFVGIKKSVGMTAYVLGMVPILFQLYLFINTL